MLETLITLIAVALGYMIARVIGLWTIYRVDQTREKAVKAFDHAFLRTCHIKAEEDTCKPSGKPSLK